MSSDMRERCDQCVKHGRVCMHVVWSPMCESCGGDLIHGPTETPCRRCETPTRTARRDLVAS